MKLAAPTLAGFVLASALLPATSLSRPAEAASIPVHLTGPQDNEVCLGCHKDSKLKRQLPNGRVVSLHVDPATWLQTVHAGRTCTDCHTDIKTIPHRKRLEPVNCGRCHYVEEIAGTTMPKKPAEYKESVHRSALLRGNNRAPTCQNCHGTHNIFPPSDPRSSVYRPNVPKMCGGCHIDIYSDYRESIHGQALLAGNKDVPVCTDCHGEHSIRSPKNPRSSVYPTRVPETCSKCHESEAIQTRYRLPRGRYATYRESYHGIANKFGSLVVANCASCHGAHDIRPSSDPKSSVNRRNLPATCGKCHKGANANFARGKIHVVVSKKEEATLYYVSSGFKWLTILTMTALVGHIALDLLAKRRRKRTAG